MIEPKKTEATPDRKQNGKTETEGIFVNRTVRWTLDAYRHRLARNTKNPPEEGEGLWRIIGAPFLVEVSDYKSLMDLVQLSKDSESLAREVEVTYGAFDLFLNENYDKFDLQNATELKEKFNYACDEESFKTLLKFVQYYYKNGNAELCSVFCQIGEKYWRAIGMEDPNSENSIRFAQRREVLKKIMGYSGNGIFTGVCINNSRMALIIVFIAFLLYRVFG